LKLSAGPETVIQQAYRLLAKTPSRLITATLDDALAVSERPNLPGTNIATNWSMTLPVPLEMIKKKKLVREISRICSRKSESEN